MLLIDTHSHIYHEDYQTDIDEVIASAKEVGVHQIYLPNIDLDSVAPMHHLTQKYPGYCIPMMGLHPTSVDRDYLAVLKQLKQLLAENEYAAVGEIGIDLYWDKTHMKEQQLAFGMQIEWAIEHSLPLVIHVRDSFRETMEVLRTFDAENLSGVFHSFCGSEQDALEILELKNFYLGINGIVTFKNSDLRSVLKQVVPLSRLVLETDAPYLTPAPHRGKRNHPAYLQLIARQLAEVYDTTPENIARITSENAEKLFRKTN